MFLQPCIRGLQPAALGGLLVEVNKSSCIITHTFYHIAIILYILVCVSVAFVWLAHALPSLSSPGLRREAKPN